MAVNVDRYNVLEWLAAHPNGESLPVWVAITRRLPEFHIAPTAWAVYTLRLLCADIETFHAATGCTEHGLRLLLQGKQQPTVGQLGWFALACSPITPQTGCAHIRRASKHYMWFSRLWALGSLRGGSEHIAELVWAYVLHHSIYRVMRTGEVDARFVGRVAFWAYETLASFYLNLDTTAHAAAMTRARTISDMWITRMLAQVEKTPKPVYTPPVPLQVFDGGAIDFDAVVGVVMGNGVAGAALTTANVWGATRKRGRPPGARNKYKGDLDTLRRGVRYDAGDGE